MWLATTCLVASCASAPDDDRSAAERLTDAVFDVAAAPVAVVVDTVAGPALDEAEDVANRIHEFRQSRRHRRDARALCLAAPKIYAGACATAFPEFHSAAPDAERGEAPPEPRGAPPAGVANGRGSTPPNAPTGATTAPDRRDTDESATDAPVLNWMRLDASLRAYEGLSLDPYKDGGGTWHICVGHALQVDEADCGALLRADMREGARIAAATVGADTWAALDPVRREALAHLGFATSLPTFVDLVAAVRRGDWQAAGDEVLDSEWARTVGATRANDVADQLRTGET
ncbi:MAG: hypothetical protein F4057_02150 [Acidobacteria bacterium]|nr:hypothetical protein [Acidobacteriota bacterium]